MHLGHVCRRVFAVLALSGLVAAMSVVGSPSAGAATVPNPNQRYVGALYRDLLDRKDPFGDLAGMNLWVNRLKTHSRLSVVRSIQFGSVEYYTRITELGYASFLDRPADQAGQAVLIKGLLSRRITYERMVATLVGSTEYFRRAGGTNAKFVDSAYADILGRHPAQSALNHFVAVAASQGRTAVALALATSTEERTLLVKFQYGSLLGRPVEPAALKSWLNQLANGLRWEEFDAELMSSNEYYAHNS